MVGRSRWTTTGEPRSTWRVTDAAASPEQSRALEDAGELAHREAISVWWAVPLRGRAAVGRFWAFFPTEDRTTLSGIVNAPWKMGDDRRNLLPGRFNEEILDRGASCSHVRKEWRHLVDPEDPASVLDVLPARGRESRSWADDVADEPVFRQIARTASLPDVTGVLKEPEQAAPASSKYRSGPILNLLVFPQPAPGRMGTPRNRPHSRTAAQGGASRRGQRVRVGR